MHLYLGWRSFSPLYLVEWNNTINSNSFYFASVVLKLDLLFNDSCVHLSHNWEYESKLYPYLCGTTLFFGSHNLVLAWTSGNIYDAEEHKVCLCSISCPLVPFRILCFRDYRFHTASAIQVMCVAASMVKLVQSGMNYVRCIVRSVFWTTICQLRTSFSAVWEDQWM
jgi:hypothetical protein